VRKRLLGTLTTAAAFAGVMTTGPTAVAEANPPNCPKGFFCAYSGENQTGSIVVRTEGNWSGNVRFRSAFNNGNPFPGADHVNMTYAVSGGGGETVCLHYNPGPGTYKGNAAPGVSITRVVWRGEC